jgi:hypothetical protein
MRGLTKVVQSELEKTCQYSIQVWLDQVICGDDDHNVSDEVARGKWQSIGNQKSFFARKQKTSHRPNL